VGDANDELTIMIPAMVHKMEYYYHLYNKNITSATEILKKLRPRLQEKAPAIFNEHMSLLLDSTQLFEHYSTWDARFEVELNTLLTALHDSPILKLKMETTLVAVCEFSLCLLTTIAKYSIVIAIDPTTTR
jgi:hypothetical protein